MIVIYAEKADMGCKFAASLGGIPYKGRVLDLREYEALSMEQHREIQRNGKINFKYKNRDFIVTWGAGHFGTLREPRDLYPDLKWAEYSLPIIPEKFQAKLRDKANERQFKIVSELFNDPNCEYIISATDFEREGELIFAYTYELTGTRKPYKRVRINETTEEGIRSGFSKRYSAMENLPKEVGAKVRGIADWIVGMNLTIASTTKLGNELINVGRVITPTLAMIVDLEKEITNFVSKPFFTVFGEFTLPSGEKYKGKYDSDPYDTAAEAEAVISTLPSSAYVKSIEKKRGQKKPEKPFDTATLQNVANKKFKMSLKKVDEIAESLYMGGYITYPRVDSRFLTEDQKEQLPERIRRLAAMPEYEKYISDLSSIDVPDMYFNNKKVEGHHAIIVTGNIPKGLSEDEWKIYDLVARQTIALAYPPVLLEKTNVVTMAGEHKFVTTGTIILDPGWSAVGFESNYKNDVPPGIEEGMNATPRFFSEEGKTTPPKRYTPGSLVRAMEICGRKVKGAEEKKLLEKMKGLGRPSTRASIVERLQKCDYIEIKKNTIYPTSKGIQVIDILALDTLKSPEMSANWEKRIDEIEESDPAKCVDVANSFMVDISAQTREWIDEINKIAMKGQGIGDSKSFPCPCCGGTVKNLKYSYVCNCGFKINKTIAGHHVSDKDLKNLLENGRTAFITNFKSKEGKQFPAYLVINKDEKKLEFSKDSLFNCPKCGKPMRPFNSQKGYYCSGWQKDGQGCDFKLFVEMNGKKLSGRDVKDLFEKGHTKSLEFTPKDGKKYKAQLAFDDECNLVMRKGK